MEKMEKPTKLTRKNVHQRPIAVPLYAHRGISCSRHLANREVEVTLFLPNFLKMQESVPRDDFCRSSGRQVASIKDLPTSLVDLVINCQDCCENRLILQSVRNIRLSSQSGPSLWVFH